MSSFSLRVEPVANITHSRLCWRQQETDRSVAKHDAVWNHLAQRMFSPRNFLCLVYKQTTGSLEVVWSWKSPNVKCTKMSDLTTLHRIIKPRHDLIFLRARMVYPMRIMTLTQNSWRSNPICNPTAKKRKCTALAAAASSCPASLVLQQGAPRMPIKKKGYSVKQAQQSRWLSIHSVCPQGKYTFWITDP